MRRSGLLHFGGNDVFLMVVSDNLRVCRLLRGGAFAVVFDISNGLDRLIGYLRALYVC